MTPTEKENMQLKERLSEAECRIAELEKERDDLHAAVAGLVSELSRERELRQAVEKDAERYRWLKNQQDDFNNMGRHSYFSTKLWNTLWGVETANDWDIAIDAAILASQQGGKS